MSAKDKTENLKNMRLPARAHVKPLFTSPTLHSRDPKLHLTAASMSQTSWTLVHRWQWLDMATDHIWRHQTNSKFLINMFMKITFFWGIKLWIHKAIDVFIIYCGEGRWHISVFSRVQSCHSMYSLPTFELRRLLSDPAGNFIYCINLVTLCVYNKVISLHILINHFLLIRSLLQLVLKMEAVCTHVLITWS
jgi:hypothetical protein